MPPHNPAPATLFSFPLLPLQIWALPSVPTPSQSPVHIPSRPAPAPLPTPASVPACLAMPSPASPFFCAHRLIRLPSPRRNSSLLLRLRQPSVPAVESSRPPVTPLRSFIVPPPPFSPSLVFARWRGFISSALLSGPSFHNDNEPTPAAWLASLSCAPAPALALAPRLSSTLCTSMPRPH